MSALYITRHAVERYIERVAPVSRKDARDAILSHRAALEGAADFAGDASVTVRLKNGVRIVLCDHHVLTVLGAP